MGTGLHISLNYDINIHAFLTLKILSVMYLKVLFHFTASATAKRHYYLTFHHCYVFLHQGRAQKRLTYLQTFQKNLGRFH